MVSQTRRQHRRIAVDIFHIRIDFVALNEKLS